MDPASASKSRMLSHHHGEIHALDGNGVVFGIAHAVDEDDILFWVYAQKAGDIPRRAAASQPQGVLLRIHVIFAEPAGDGIDGFKKLCLGRG